MDHPIPLALPDFIYTEPTLAQGGGAEVVSLANPAWFTNNGFSADFSFISVQSALSAPFHLQLPSLSTPFGFDSSPDQPHPHPPPPSATTPDFTILQRNVPPPLPVYSASGFDLLSILARVANRPNPRVILGSVDLKCSFVVVDTRRFDHPIVYCSPSFCSLTGYSEQEIIGRNCRFLQAPAGNIRKGDLRKHTSHEAVAHLRKSLVANKECQTTIRNFRKDGFPFMNLLTVIPLPGGLSGSPDEENEYVYHVGFQVDLAQQPNAILEKFNHGSYLVNYSTTSRQNQLQNQPSPTSRKSNNLPAVVMSNELRKLIADPTFITSIPLSTSTTVTPSVSASSPNQDDPVISGANHFLHLLLLEAAPDFIHVVSLKGSFLYVAPSVRRALGYEPEELLGKAISDFAHPKDVVPLMRELKESSATGGPAEGVPHAGSSSPRTVNLLFRARTRMGNYVWVESRGRLHVEPGKGRKAIVLSGRTREMSRLTWDEVKFAGGLARGIEDEKLGRSESRRLVEQEVWGMISGHRQETMTFLSVGKGVEDVLGWSADDLIGRNVMDIVLDEGARTLLGSVVANRNVYHHSHGQSSGGFAVKRVHCALRKKGSGVANVWFIIYRAEPIHDQTGPGFAEKSVGSPVPLVYQIRLVEAHTILPELASEAGTATLVLPLPTPPCDDPPELSSSSLAGAVPILNFASSSGSSPLSTPTPLDMFEELAISKGSSWQYELQQLRFANTRLREELAALQVSLAGSDDENGGTDKITTATQVQYPSNGVLGLGSVSQYQEQQLYADSLPSSFHRQYRPFAHNQQMTQRQQHQPSSSSCLVAVQSSHIPTPSAQAQNRVDGRMSVGQHNNSALKRQWDVYE